MSTRLEAALAELAAALREELAAAVPDPATPDQLLSIDQASAALSIGRTRLYAEINAGRLRVVRAGRRVLVPSSAIREFVEAAGR